MSEIEFRPRNQETHPEYNREPGIVVVPGSNYANEMQKWEQFPSKYGQNPGNPYQYRPFPKMVYRADMYMGKIVCMAEEPNPAFFSNPGEYAQKQNEAFKFNQKCSAIVNDERELQAALEKGYRESPAEAVALIEARERSRSTAAAERAHADSRMSETARAEAKAIDEASDVHLPEIPEQPKRRRGRPRKNEAV